jgi:glycine/D-amino acid oxidase-like deaminating enzyme
VRTELSGVLQTDFSLFQVMGYSDDGFPYVGPLPDKSGQYICAGFSGHGMPQIFLSTKAVAEMVVCERKLAEVDLPVPYHITPQRWNGKKEHVSLQAWRVVSGAGIVKARL